MGHVESRQTRPSIQPSIIALRNYAKHLVPPDPRSGEMCRGCGPTGRERRSRDKGARKAYQAAGQRHLGDVTPTKVWYA
eukprot:43895-Chlamydomonas_euryale.AAC.4